jgi:hypothetical protein
MKELNATQVNEVAGGDINLGTLYQYTGDPADRNVSERVRDGVYGVFDFIFGELYYP